MELAMIRRVRAETLHPRTTSAPRAVAV